MYRLGTHAAALTLAALGFTPDLLEAQKKTVEFTPLIGMYVPFGTLVEERTYSPSAAIQASVVDPGAAATLQPAAIAARDLYRRRQVGAPIIGIRLGSNPDDAIGLEGSLSYTPALVAVTSRSETRGSTRDYQAGIAFASARTVLRIRDTVEGAGTWTIFLAPGVALINRHGIAWEGFADKLDKALVLAGGARLQGKNSKGAFRIELEDYVSRPAFNSGRTDQTKPQFHHDMTYSVGFAFPIGR